MAELPADLRDRLERHGQKHVAEWSARLKDEEHAHLLKELQAIDVAELQKLYAQRDLKEAVPERSRVQPMPRPHFDAAKRQAFQQEGERAFARGEVAFLLVAGGQGTRLGFDHPKGMFPIGPVTQKPLFQIHTEKILALRRRHDIAIPFLIMTSPATDEETRAYFRKHNNFGLPAEDVGFFCQGTMPALDLASGKLLFDAPGRLCLSPNGHGGTLTGLKDSGLLNRLDDRGIRTISYFQVDNPLVKLADYVFLGRHLAERAEVSSKVLPKTGPKEKVGLFVLIDGQCSMIEYSDLPDEWAHETDAKGDLQFWAGNPAIHLFDVSFLRKVVQEASRLPWHVAKKKVPYINEQGESVAPGKENALKFERFIFDALPHAERWTVLPTSREEEFAPVKNADGIDSAESSRQAMSNLAATWLRHAGVEVPSKENGNAAVAIEISPLFALDAEELAQKVKGIRKVQADTYLA